VKVELGCGRHPKPGFVTVDANPNVDADYHCDAAGPLPFEDGSVEEMRCVDVLEHIPFRRTIAALSEWKRVLAFTGKIYVQVPDCGRIMQRWALDPGAWYDERLPADVPQHPFMGVAWRILGGQDDGGITRGDDDPGLNLHLAMFDVPYFEWCLRGAGLRAQLIEVNVHPNICATVVHA
jgi:predicted SAM-dependent methyltransferase